MIKIIFITNIIFIIGFGLLLQTDFGKELVGLSYSIQLEPMKRVISCKMTDTGLELKTQTQPYEGRELKTFSVKNTKLGIFTGTIKVIEN